VGAAKAPPSGTNPIPVRRRSSQPATSSSRAPTSRARGPGPEARSNRTVFTTRLQSPTPLLSSTHISDSIGITRATPPPRARSPGPGRSTRCTRRRSRTSWRWLRSSPLAAPSSTLGPPSPRPPLPSSPTPSNPGGGGDGTRVPCSFATSVHVKIRCLPILKGMHRYHLANNITVCFFFEFE